MTWDREYFLLVLAADAFLHMLLEIHADLPRLFAVSYKEPLRLLCRNIQMSVYPPRVSKPVPAKFGVK